MMRMIVAIGSGEATTMKLNNVYMCKGSQFNSVSHDFCHVKKSPLRKFKKAYSTYLFLNFAYIMITVVVIMKVIIISI